MPITLLELLLIRAGRFFNSVSNGNLFSMVILVVAQCSSFYFLSSQLTQELQECHSCMKDISAGIFSFEKETFVLMNRAICAENALSSLIDTRLKISLYILGIYIVGYLLTDHFFGCSPGAGTTPSSRSPEEEFVLCAQYLWTKGTTNFSREEFVQRLRALTHMKNYAMDFNAGLGPNDEDKKMPTFDDYNYENLEEFAKYFDESREDMVKHGIRIFHALIMNYEAKVAVDMVVEDLVEELANVFDETLDDYSFSGGEFGTLTLPEILSSSIFLISFLAIAALGLDVDPEKLWSSLA